MTLSKMNIEFLLPSLINSKFYLSLSTLISHPKTKYIGYALSAALAYKKGLDISPGIIRKLLAAYFLNAQTFPSKNDHRQHLIKHLGLLYYTWCFFLDLKERNLNTAEILVFFFFNILGTGLHYMKFGNPHKYESGIVGSFALYLYSIAKNDLANFSPESKLFMFFAIGDVFMWMNTMVEDFPHTDPFDLIEMNKSTEIGLFGGICGYLFLVENNMPATLFAMMSLHGMGHYFAKKFYYKGFDFQLFLKNNNNNN